MKRGAGPKAKRGPVLAQMLAQVSGPVKPVQIPV